MIRCFGVTQYRGDGEGHDCVIHAACNVISLFLGERSAAFEVSLLHRSITLASARCRPHTERHLEISNLLKLGRLSPIFQNAGTSWHPENGHSSSWTSAVGRLPLQFVIRKEILLSHIHRSLIRTPHRGSCDCD